MWCVVRCVFVGVLIGVFVGVCVERVCGMCVLFFVVVCCAVSLCVGVGAGVQCVCGVCGAAWHAENPLCVDSKRLSVHVQDVHTEAF